ncbi:hypothetical protein MSG28_001742 [Choristoneura fumiferana]|uniref:Uncharacterized protein n=1 Tax=Choristoneura fumiferana TaxID=7141 RepID=A0ACC0KV93_CHOFU|nr:hypothetical protein MSG28_001742 [Choristoneura fumiferana]
MPGCWHLPEHFTRWWLLDVCSEQIFGEPDATDSQIPQQAGGVGGTGPGRAARARALELAQQLASSLQHAVPPPPRPDFTTASAILRWLQQNNNHVALKQEEMYKGSVATDLVAAARCASLVNGEREVGSASGG